MLVAVSPTSMGINTGIPLKTENRLITCPSHTTSGFLHKASKLSRPAITNILAYQWLLRHKSQDHGGRTKKAWKALDLSGRTEALEGFEQRMLLLDWPFPTFILNTEERPFGSQ